MYGEAFRADEDLSQLWKEIRLENPGVHSGLEDVEDVEQVFDMLGWESGGIPPRMP